VWTWRVLDRRVAQHELVSRPTCDVHLEAAGSRLDVNDASIEELRAVFAAMGLADAGALADALADWRDADDAPRPLGAEASWYDMVHRLRPRNAPLADAREIALVRGFEQPGRFDSVLGVAPARLAVNSAPLVVLASVPGLSAELRQRIGDERAAGRPIGDVLDLAGRLSPGTAEELRAHYPEIARLTTVDPDAWLVVARGEAGRPRRSVTIELRLVRAGRRAVVLGRRTW
jgi:type II secretory pathway component PulK